MSHSGTLLIIDGNGLMHRAFHALPDFKAKDGMPTNAVYGFASVLHKVKHEVSPTHIVVCFDTPAPTFRDELFAQYRTQRPEIDPTLVQQFPMVEEFLQAAGIPFYLKDGVEADDLIAVAVKAGLNHNMHVIILTGDKDIFQLVSNDVTVLTPAIGFSKGKLYTPDEVHEKFGIPPEKIPDYKALVGDPSDNYKGVKGIGPKAAVKLLNQFGSIESIYERLNEVVPERTRALLIQEKEHALLSKKLAILLSEVDDVHVDIDAAAFSHYNESLRDFCDAYQFRSLERRFFEDSVEKKPSPEKHEKEAGDKDQLELF
jgi:DNA polymerase-1